MSDTIDAPADWITSVSQLRFPCTTDARIQILMDRNTEGVLGPEESEELKALVDLSEELSLVRAQALKLLKVSAA